VKTEILEPIVNLGSLRWNYHTAYSGSAILEFGISLLLLGHDLDAFLMTAFLADDCR
jgi:hypothetical protein